MNPPEGVSHHVFLCGLRFYTQHNIIFKKTCCTGVQLFNNIMVDSNKAICIISQHKTSHSTSIKPMLYYCYVKLLLCGPLTPSSTEQVILLCVGWFVWLSGGWDKPRKQISIQRGGSTSTCWGFQEYSSHSEDWWALAEELNQCCLFSDSLFFAPSHHDHYRPALSCITTWDAEELETGLCTATLPEATCWCCGFKKSLKPWTPSDGRPTDNMEDKWAVKKAAGTCHVPLGKKLVCVRTWTMSPRRITEDVCKWCSFQSHLSVTGALFDVLLSLKTWSL